MFINYVKLEGGEEGRSLPSNLPSNFLYEKQAERDAENHYFSVMDSPETCPTSNLRHKSTMKVFIQLKAQCAFSIV